MHQAPWNPATVGTSRHCTQALARLDRTSSGPWAPVAVNQPAVLQLPGTFLRNLESRKSHAIQHELEGKAGWRCEFQNHNHKGLCFFFSFSLLLY